MFTDTTWLGSIVDLVSDISEVIVEPPFNYFLILSLLAIVIGMVKGFIKR